MKYLPITTILLWLSIVFGFLYAREFILQPIVKFPVFILLSIFLPVCFWILASNNRKIYSSVFIAIFTFNTAILAYTVLSSYSFFKSFDPYKETRIDPQVAELLITGESEEIRNVAGQVIFEKHGVSLPYKTETDHFILYAPTKTNKYKFQRNSAENARLSFLKYNTIYQIDSLLFLLILQVSIFIGLLCFLVLHDSPARLPLEGH
jgi:hypothetical protein